MNMRIDDLNESKAKSVLLKARDAARLTKDYQDGIHAIDYVLAEYIGILEERIQKLENENYLREIHERH